MQDDADRAPTRGKYLPAWTESVLNYQIPSKCSETLWKQYRVDDKDYERCLYVCRDGVLSRLRNLQTCQEHEARRAAQEALAACVKRLRSDPSVCPPFPVTPEAQEWLKAFWKNALRYPILVVIGLSCAGKIEWA